MEKNIESTIGEQDLIISMRKLNLIKELSDKESQFQHLKENLQQNANIIVRENQVLREFRKELDLLVQERMSHIEELRLIHADINIMETTIKQAEEERLKNVQESKRILKDYQPVKEQINKIREALNLDQLSTESDDETAVQLIQQQSNEQDANSTRTIDTALDQSHEQRIPFHSSTVLPKTIGTNIDRSNLRQQPPPMKTCQSCQQQIHRNAPICPICKAKSRSRNPKKPKRRHTDLSQK